jgi:hypothetical protein
MLGKSAAVEVEATNVERVSGALTIDLDLQTNSMSVRTARQPSMSTA